MSIPEGSAVPSSASSASWMPIMQRGPIVLSTHGRRKHLVHSKTYIVKIFALNMSTCCAYAPFVAIVVVVSSLTISMSSLSSYWTSSCSSAAKTFHNHSLLSRYPKFVCLLCWQAHREISMTLFALPLVIFKSHTVCFCGGSSTTLCVESACRCITSCHQSAHQRRPGIWNSLRHCIVPCSGAKICI
jgi:hypothetical protein